MMPYSYAGTLATYGSAYQIAKAVESGVLFEVAKRLYSDERHPDPNAVACALWPQAAQAQIALP